MTIKQISIFLENKYGKLSQILSHLSGADIEIISANVADTTDYGILRLITTNQQRAYQLLKEKGVSITLTEVFAIEIGASVETISATIDLFTKAGIDIDYMYCFSTNENAILVLRTKNLEAAYDVIRANNLNFINNI